MTIQEALRSELPNLKYQDGKKRMVTLRMPIKLMKELTDYAERNGWATSKLISAFLDLAIQAQVK